jgi:hypothetical protein
LYAGPFFLWEVLGREEHLWDLTLMVLLSFSVFCRLTANRFIIFINIFR